MLVTQLTSADVLKYSSGGGKPWQVVLSFDSRVHLQPVGQKSSGSLMIFDTRTSRCSEDMNNTYGPSDHRLETFRESNEIWGVISIHKKILLSDIRDAALNMYDIYVAWPGWLSRALLWLWQSKLRQVCQGINSGEWEGNWMDLLLPARNINRNIMWPVTTKCLSTDKAPCVPVGDKIHVPQYFSHLLLFQHLSVYFSLSHAKGRAQQFSTAGGWRMGITACVTTPPTQSWSCTVFKMEKQSQECRVGPPFHTGQQASENQGNYFGWFNGLPPTGRQAVTSKALWVPVWTTHFTLSSDLSWKHWVRLQNTRVSKWEDEKTSGDLTSHTSKRLYQ